MKIQSLSFSLCLMFAQLNAQKKALTFSEAELQGIPSLRDIEKTHLEYQKSLMRIFLKEEFSSKSAKEVFSDPMVRAEFNAAKIFTDLMIQSCQRSVSEADTLLLAINKVLK
jgi:hypothetical protein